MVERLIYSGTRNPCQPCIWFRLFLLLYVGQYSLWMKLQLLVKKESNPINAALPCPLASCRSNEPKGFRSFIAAGRQQGSNLHQKTYYWVCNSSVGKAAGISAWLRIAWLRPVTLTGTIFTLHLKMVIWHVRKSHVIAKSHFLAGSGYMLPIHMLGP